MGWPFIVDARSAIEFIMCASCVLMGLSHMVQPRMWRDYFTALHEQGAPGIVTRTFTLELWPALIIVTLHQHWSGPGAILTVYGWLLLAKCCISVLMPQIGLRSLAMAKRGDSGFVLGGAVLLMIGISAGLALWWR